MARALPRLPATRPAPWGWAAAGALAGLLLALVLFAPARWLAQAVAAASGGQVLLQRPSRASKNVHVGSKAVSATGRTQNHGILTQTIQTGTARVAGTVAFVRVPVWAL